MSIEIVAFRPSGDHEWTQWAECAKPYAPDMFPHDQDTAGIQRARQTCAGCPVAVECLTEAMARGESHGVWGGLTADERHNLRRRSSRPDRKVLIPLTDMIRAAVDVEVAA